MKTVQNNFTLLYLLLVIAQLLICNYLHLSSLVTLSILPVLVLCLPTSLNTIIAMVIAFFTGMTVDLLADGTLGLNILSLVPVALIRLAVIKSVFGEDVVERGDTFSFKKNGPIKISVSMLIVLTVFFLVYIMADGAGTRPFWFNLARFAASLTSSYILGLLIVHILTSQSKQ